MTRTIACAFAALLVLCSSHARALDTRVTGTFNLASTEGSSVSITFTCTGEPACTGNYQAQFHIAGCSNTMYLGNSITITGLNLAQAGTLQGVNLFFKRLNLYEQHNGDGTCFIKPSPLPDDDNFTLPVTWNGSTGIGLLSVPEPPYVISGVLSFTADRAAAAPLFPLVVVSTVDPTTASATAQLQYRPQDVGTTGSVFVFLLAPRSLVRGLQLAKDDGDCVLAQISGGQLTAVTASTMQPAVTGVLSAQGASLTLLNNVSTPTVAGSQVFVGYASDAATMLSTGISQGAVSIPGSQQCATSLTKSPGALSGLFGNTSEAGWGINFTQRGNNTFAAWYTYDGSGNPKWYVATCAGAGATSGTCSGTLFQVTGPTFFNRPFSSSAVNAASAGNLQVTFQNPDRATVNYTVGTQSRSVTVERTAFPPGTTPPAIDHTDLWWDPNESGWGVALTQKYAVIFAAWYVYSDVGQPVWYVVPNCAVNTAGNRCTGAIFRTTGPAFGPTFNSTSVTAFETGTATFTFTDANNGSMSYTVNGVSGSKTITRNIF